MFVFKKLNPGANSFFKIRPIMVAAKSNVGGSSLQTKFTHLCCTAHITKSTHFLQTLFCLVPFFPESC